MKNTLKASLIFLMIWIVSCKENESGVDLSDKHPNILLIIADDMGLDATNGYSEGSIKPKTPHLDDLMNDGLRFTHFWTNSVCSPTRATILTGKYGYQTQVLSQFDEIAISETSLQSYINQKTNHVYATAVVGKWHLAGKNNSFNPEIMGIDYYAGQISGAAKDYYSWNLTEDGIVTEQTEYITTKFTDLAIDWVNLQANPWFLWLAYTAPHTPFHVPPEETHSQGSLSADPSAIDADPIPYFMASIESMDYQIGKLLTSLSEEDRENTIIIFIGDNGTTNKVAQLPYKRGKVKGSLYQGGINCPMIISGPGVTMKGVNSSLINSTDLFATIASLAGVEVQEIHSSKNFELLLNSENSNFRELVYSEFKDDTKDEWCIRNDSYKLIEEANGNQELYNLQTDPYETLNLLDNTLSLEAQQAKDWLEQKLINIRQ